jgi:hypothetical protein
MCEFFYFFINFISLCAQYIYDESMCARYVSKKTKKRE